MKNKKIILGVITLGIFLEIMDSSIANVSIYTFASIFHSTINSAQLISSVYLLFLGVFTPLAIWASKNYSLRTALLFGFSMFGIGSLLCSLATSVESLVIFRVVQAFGASFMLPISRIYLRTYFRKTLLKISSSIATVFLMAYAIGPIVGSFIMSHFMWQYIFFINIPMIIACIIVLCVYQLKENDGKSSKFDLIGYILYASIVAAFISLSDDMHVNMVCIIVIVSCIILYVMHLRHHKSPIISKKLLKNHAFIAIASISFLMKAVIVQILFMLPLLLQFKYKVSISDSALVVACYGPAAVLTRALMAKYGTIAFKKLFQLFIVSLLFYFLLPLTDTYFMSFSYFLIFITGLINAAMFANIHSYSSSTLAKDTIEEGSVLYSSILQVGASFGLAALNLISVGNAYHYYPMITLSLVLTLIAYYLLRFTSSQ